jgi:hypothetical protein
MRSSASVLPKRRETPRIEIGSTASRFDRGAAARPVARVDVVAPRGPVSA